MSDFDQIKYNNEFNKKNYDRTTIMTPKGKKDKIKEICKALGCSMNEFIISAIDEKIERISNQTN